MYNQLPSQFEPFTLARAGASFAGVIPISQLDRLKGLLSEDAGELSVTLSLTQDEGHRALITGKVEGQLVLVCQRCSGPVCYDINVDLKLSPVKTDSQAKNIPKEYDLWVTNDEPIQVVALVEEEVLLSLPMMPKHKREECSVDLPKTLQ